MTAKFGSLLIEGFRSIRAQKVEFGDLNVLIGANGAGKSNLIRAIQLLSFIGTEGLGEFVGRSGGASQLLHMGPRKTPILLLEAEFRLASGVATYRARLAHAAGDTLIFTHEEVGYRPKGKDEQRWTGLGSGHAESKLRLARQDGDVTAKTVLWHLHRISRYHFHDTGADSSIRAKTHIDDDRDLRSDAGNLAAWLHSLAQTDPARLSRIEGTIRQIAPYFGGFDLTPSRRNPDYISLEWKDSASGHVFQPGALSDGTLRSMALVSTLLQTDEAMPAVAAIDEPELGLHPFAMGVIASLMKAASQRTQFVVSTQSTRLLDHFSASDVIVADRADGASTFTRLDDAALSDWLEDYDLSELWEKNVLGGGPSV